MKKWSKLLVFAAIGLSLGFASCSSSDDTDPNSNSNSGVGENAYVGLNIITATAPKGLKAVEIGESYENKINTIDVLFFKKSSGLLIKLEPMTLSAFTGSGTSTAPYKATRAIELKKDDYDVVIMLNRPGSLTLTEGTSKKADIEDEVSMAVENLYGGSAKDNFFMTNASGYVTLLGSAMYPSAQAALDGTHLALKAERAVAKILVKAKDETIANINKDGIHVSGESGNPGTINDVKWVATTTNKKTYWMRHMAPKYAGNGFAGPMETVSDYTDTGRENLYAIDPNFYGTFIASDFNTLTSATNELFKTSAPVYEYVLENTMTAEKQLKKETTSVLIKVKFTPKNNSDGYFYTFDKEVFSQGQLNTIVPSGDVAFKNLKDAYDKAKTAGYKLDGTDTASFSFKSTDESNVTHELCLYKDNLMYYYIPIRHFMQQEVTMGYGRYGVVRNNVYKLTINSIKIGKPEIPEPGDETDDEVAYIGIDFEVTPWYIREQGVNLE